MKQLEFVESFIRDIYEASKEESAPYLKDGLFFSRKDYGMISLSKDEARRYFEVLSKLMSIYSSDKYLSRNAVEGAFKGAIFSAFGRYGVEPPPLSDRLKNALNQLNAELTQKKSNYTIFVPIGGASNNGLPFVFGKIRFVIFNENQLQKFRFASRKHQVCASEIDKRLKIIRDLKKRELWDFPYAIVQVMAKDSFAAKQIAIEDTQRTLDALNFFTDLTPYQLGYLFMPGDRSQAIKMTLVLEDTSSWLISSELAGPMQEYDFRKLRDAKNLRKPLKRLHKILKYEGSNEIDNVILTAICWAGRADIETRREHAFLWYAIALESAIIPTDNRQELGYKLRMRIAKLLKSELDRNKDVKNEVKDLYKKRSEIVHNGWYKIEESDLELIRGICKISLIRLLTHRSVSRLNSKRMLDEWFDNSLL